MARASAALAPFSHQTGVVFHGMAGAGKTACALELAHHFEGLERFTGFVWYEAPREGHSISNSLGAFARAFETQLSDENLVPAFPLIHVVGTDKFDAYLPRLRQFLESRSVLLVFDNMESLLYADGRWREERWERLIAALASHRGLSRAVLATRIRPAMDASSHADRAVSGKQGLLPLAIHTLSLDEAVLLARQLPHLGALLRGERTSDARVRQRQRELVAQALRLVQGHPKLLELAEGQAERPEDLERHLSRATKAGPAGLEAFFEEGESTLGAADFLAILIDWTRSVARAQAAEAQAVFNVLCCLEEQDRQSALVEEVLPRIWRRLEFAGEPPRANESLLALRRAALVDAEESRPGSEQLPGMSGHPEEVYRLHPCVAEAGRAGAGERFQAAVDAELANAWVAAFVLGRRLESEGGGVLVVRAALRAAPYLMRQSRWDTASELLHEVLRRDSSPATAAAVLPLLDSMEHV